MSDGDAGADAATHGPDGDDVGLTGTPPDREAPRRGNGSGPRLMRSPSPIDGRRRRPRPRRPSASPRYDHETGGSHTDGGLTVADLIAKVGAPAAGRPRHHHAAPEPEPAPPESPLPIDERDNGYHAYAPSAASEYA